MSSHEDYTVGWICGISTEYVAAQSFLDERHDGPEDVSVNDSNDYTLGKIGKHNVVIAVLPDGEYGSASAATVARDMLHTFPNVRIGLLVGIGGGAPSKKHDIRLGDVVVSVPSSKATGSVLHYDFSKTMQDQSFETIGYMNLPPTLLRAAVNGLKADYESDGHQIQDSINRILQKKSRLRKKYTRPDQSSDRLYRSGTVHPFSEDEFPCVSVCGNNPSNLIRRSDRDEDDDNPAIHYGLIASADQLVKDAAIRDKLAAEKGILCFETEAAGLMNHFPCLVIRGICDYSDSHGNTAWRGYAAMAAAAYTKDLLSRVPPSKVQAEKKIAEILSGVQEGVNKLLHIHHGQYEEAVLKWLTSIDYAPIQMDHIARRQPGTGQWFLDSAEYQNWQKTDRQTLFCPGIPGAGKTIITAVVIDDIYNRFCNDTTIGIAYLYGDFRRQHEQSTEELLSSLVKQLIQKLASVPRDVSELYTKYKEQPKRLHLDDILMLLHSVSKLFSRVFVMVDALDECRADGCRTRLLNEIFRLQTKANTSIFLTARFIPDILERFNESNSLEIRAKDEDVQLFVANQITRLPPFVLKNPDLQQDIRTTISKAVDGMFLLAPLHMDALSQEPTVGHIELALQRLPRGLDEMYKRAMERVESQGEGNRVLAKKIIGWIVQARRALSPIELQHAVAVEPGTLELDSKFVPDIDVISTICAGLITVDIQSNAVRLVHYTTQEYFERTQGVWSLTNQIAISTVCITYLSFSTFEGGCCSTDAALVTRLQGYPLYSYAARHWGHHSRETSVFDQGTMEFLLCNAKVEASSQALMVDVPTPGYIPTDWSQKFPGTMTGLHLAAYFGLEEAVRTLLQSHDPNAKDSHERTPLSYAAENGHKAVVQLLLNTGIVDVNSGDRYGETPLFKSANNGHEAVVELLLAKGDINPDSTPHSSSNYSGRTPLSYAAENGHKAVVEQLLAHPRVNPDSEASGLKEFGRTPLSFATEKGHDGVVKLLLAQPGVNPLSTATLETSWGTDINIGTPLSLAAEYGHEAILRLLVTPENVNERCTVTYVHDSGRTALSYAAGNGHEAIVRYLLTVKNVDVHIKSTGRYNSGRSALSYAAEHGNETVVALLLAAERASGSGSTVNCRSTGHEERSDTGRTALSFASRKGHEAVVRMLLAVEGIDVNSQDCRGQTALALAARKGHEAVVRLLLAVEGINVNSRDCYEETAISLAAMRGYEVMVRLLLKAGGFDVSSEEYQRATAMLLAATTEDAEQTRSLRRVEEANT